MKRAPLIIFLIIVLFIGYQILANALLFGDAKDENTLRKRYEEFIALEKEDKFEEMYDKFLADSEKINITKQSYNDKKGKDQWKKDRKNRGIVRENYIINNVIIRDNTGFIDRTFVSCYDQECSNTETRRAYKKWLYVGNKWYATSEAPLCIRDVGYDTAPEFKRALSLIFQRAKSYDSRKRYSHHRCHNQHLGPLDWVGTECNYKELP